MARIGKREPTREVHGGDVTDAAGHVEEAASELAAQRAEDGPTAAQDGAAVEAVTEIHAAKPLPIPPLLTDAGTPEATDPSSDGGSLADRAGIARERAAEHAAMARDRAGEHASAVREKAADHAAVARDKLSEGAGEARERLAGGAAEAKVRGTRMRKRFAEAAADARDSASTAAAEARDRVASADVNEFAHSTTRLIDTARPFFLAGFAAVFAILGFLEGEAGTAELFVGGSIIFVIGAGFSGEINAFVAHRLHHVEEPRHEPAEPRAGNQQRGPNDDGT